MKKEKIYFKQTEFECKCGCGLNNISPILFEMINKARHLAGIPFIVNSCVRCEKHNKNIGGSKTSSHLTGLAIDISAKGYETKYLIVDSLLKVGFKRILMYKTFIHVDIDLAKTNPILKVM